MNNRVKNTGKLKAKKEQTNKQERRRRKGQRKEKNWIKQNGSFTEMEHFN